MVKNFRYEEPGRIALSGYPDSAEDVDWLHNQGIRTVISLHPVPESARSRMSERGIQWVRLLLPDFASGLPSGFGDALELIRTAAAEDPAVLIHCQGGGGRSGTMYAAYLISQGVPVEEVLSRVPGTDKEVNRAFLQGFAAGVHYTKVVI